VQKPGASFTLFLIVRSDERFFDWLTAQVDQRADWAVDGIRVRPPWHWKSGMHLYLWQHIRVLSPSAKHYAAPRLAGWLHVAYQISNTQLFLAVSLRINDDDSNQKWFRIVTMTTHELIEYRYMKGGGRYALKTCVVSQEAAGQVWNLPLVCNHLNRKLTNHWAAVWDRVLARRRENAVPAVDKRMLLAGANFSTFDYGKVKGVTRKKMLLQISKDLGAVMSRSGFRWKKALPPCPCSFNGKTHAKELSTLSVAFS
jgi:hypothetical protein